MRVYHDLKANDPLMKDLCKLICTYDNFDLCDITQVSTFPKKDVSKLFPMIWRYLPAVDEQVNVVASRDLDSRTYDREAAAHKEWESSNKPFHVMRDHPHHALQILGGMWTANVTSSIMRDLWKGSFIGILNDNLAYVTRQDKNRNIVKGPDQKILAGYIWPWAQHVSLSHDSYHCRGYKSSQPFPTQRIIEPNNFAGAIYFRNVTLKVECPIECRKHKEWKYC